MDFGNCHGGGTVVAYKNGVQIASVGGSATYRIEFEFSDGDVIKITEGYGIIQFNYLEIVKCNQGEDINILLFTNTYTQIWMLPFKDSAYSILITYFPYLNFSSITSKRLHFYSKLLECKLCNQLGKFDL